MKIIEGDLLSVHTGVIAHQVNCRKVMGAGLALQIRQKYPIVYEEYLKKPAILGAIDVLPVTSTLRVANLYAQVDIKRAKADRLPRVITPKPLTSLAALECCLTKLKRACPNEAIFLPWGIGCGLGGANWEDVEEIIQKTIPNAVLICKKYLS